MKPGEKNGPVDIGCLHSAIAFQLLGISGCAITMPPERPARDRIPKPHALLALDLLRPTSALTFTFLSGGLPIGTAEFEGAYRGSAVFNRFKPKTATADGVEVSAIPPEEVEEL